MAGGGQKPIKDVQPGEQVLATDPTPAKPPPNPSPDTTPTTTPTSPTSPSPPPSSVQTLHTTQHHPIWSDTRHGWVDAADLQPGEHLGTGTTVLAVHNHTGAQTMHDLTVHRIHTYYVIAGTTPLLVHNTDDVRFRRPGFVTTCYSKPRRGLLLGHVRTGKYAGRR
jgi:hypothetical protein